MPEGLAWIMVRLDIHFRAELHWPGTIEMGLGVVEIRPHLGDLRSGGVFAKANASRRRSRSSVLIDEATRRPTPLTA